MRKEDMLSKIKELAWTAEEPDDYLLYVLEVICYRKYNLSKAFEKALHEEEEAMNDFLDSK